MKVNLKQQNYWILHDIAMRGLGSRKEAVGTKVNAIYKLIQAKGETVSSDDPKHNGLKALEISEGEFIAMKRTGPKDTFFPCSIQTIHLQNL